MRLQVFSRRWAHHDTYRVVKTADGWRIGHTANGGQCNKRGEPCLFENLRVDGINYPASLGGYLEQLWDQAERQRLNEKQIQAHLDALGKWIERVERGSPPGVWAGYE